MDLILPIMNKKIEIHPSVYFLLLLSLFTDSLNYYFQMFILILLHEGSHYLLTRIYKGKFIKLKISIFGGMIVIDTKKISPLKRVIIASTGILFHLLCFLVFTYFNLQGSFLYQYNLCMLLFNLLPIYPLDGYTIIEQLLHVRYESEYAFIKLTHITIFFNFLLTIYGFIVKKYFLIIFAAYFFVLFMIKRQDFRELKFQNILYLIK